MPIFFSKATFLQIKDDIQKLMMRFHLGTKNARKSERSVKSTQWYNSEIQSGPLGSDQTNVCGDQKLCKLFWIFQIVMRKLFDTFLKRLLTVCIAYNMRSTN